MVRACDDADSGKKDLTKLRTTGLVVGTSDPVDNKLRLGNRNNGWVRVIADAGGNQVNAVGRFDLTENRWLVVGMEIPVRVDPEKPGGFEIEWDAIPSMEERVAANDPTLADPIGARGNHDDGQIVGELKWTHHHQEAGLHGQAQGRALGECPGPSALRALAPQVQAATRHGRVDRPSPRLVERSNRRRGALG